MIEITFEKPSDFLKIKETLTRMGVASKKEKRLFQSAHIFHKKGRYFIAHFKELFILDGKQTVLTDEDIARRNKITLLLKKWCLIEIVTSNIDFDVPCEVKVIHYRCKSDWVLEPKYNIGKKLWQ